MHNEAFFVQAFIFLTAAVLAVPLASRLGLGSVLGYLIAGMVIGPFVLKLVGEEGQDVMYFAEFGVVMMLFVVGLELRPSLLWKLRVSILGSGGVQVILTAALITGIAMFFGLIWQMALAVGLTLALSSTALVLQTLNEKGLMKTAAGQRSFSVLLFQDIAVIPMLALMPLLATLEVHHGDGHHETHTWVENMVPWAKALTALGAIALVALAGRFVMGPCFRIIARSGQREVFTAAALLLVIAIALFMVKVGLSPALGTFLAGVLLSESEYRHELESDIEPFKGLLLGIFFIAVGASIDFSLIASQPGMIVGIVLGLMALKFMILFGIGKLGGMKLDQGVLFSVALCQGGEFGFVLFSFANTQGILSPELTRPLVAAVALSMALTPLLFILNERLIQPRLGTKRAVEQEPDDMDEDAPVIIAGFGRFGNVAGRFLRACKIETTVLETDSDHVDLLRSLGLKVFYGDASRHDLLHAAGADKARILILAVEEPARSLAIIHTCQKHFPNLEILARASSRDHAYQLIEAGIERIFLEQQASSLDCGVEALRTLGYRGHSARRWAAHFKDHDLENVFEMASLRGDRKRYIATGRERIEDLDRRIQDDLKDLCDIDDTAWDDSSIRNQGF